VRKRAGSELAEGGKCVFAGYHGKRSLVLATVLAISRSFFLQYSPNSTWLVTSRLDTTRHVRRVERVEPCSSDMADDEQAIVSARPVQV